jgi:DNA-binding NarL/FixJ family response regulator
VAIRIVIADDHPVVLRGLTQVFAEDREIQVVAECTDGRSALAAVEQHAPDVLVIDLDMPQLSGIDVLRRMQEAENATPAVLFAGAITDEQVVEAMRLGVRGVVLKSMAPSLLVQCVRKVAAGGTWLEKEAVGRAMTRILQNGGTSAKARNGLTPRETDIARMVAGGLNNREVGLRLFITEGTVKTHLHAVYEKLGLRGRVQLANYAKEKGLV